MMRTALVLLLLLLPMTALAATPAKILPETDPVYQVVRTVFDRVVRVVSGVPPQLYLVKADEPLTSHLGTDPLLPMSVKNEKFIVMDERLIPLAAGLGSPRERDNALAFLLGHEMAHYAAKQSGGLAGDEKIASEKLKAEEFADRMGVWYAAEAGYEPFPAAENILLKTYQTYRDGKKEPEGYPALNKRIEIIRGVKDQLNEKLPFLDAATTLMVLNRPTEAGRLFEQVGRTYESREILNNAAVASALAALSLQPPPYFYPFELETAYRFPSRSRDVDLSMLLPTTRSLAVKQELETKRKVLLEKSVKLLDHALFLDKEYATAQLNRAAVAELQDDPPTMTYHLSMAEKLAKTSGDLLTQARINILQGISLAKAGKRTEAAALFTAARPHVEQMAITNLLAIDEEPKLPPPAFIPDDPVKETISGAFPADKAHSKKIADAKALLSTDQYGGDITINMLATAGWSGARLKMGKLIVTTITTPGNYTLASKRGVRLGDLESDIYGRYGRPNRIITTRQGNLLVYSQDSIIFTVNREQKVAAWTIYSVQE